MMQYLGKAKSFSMAVIVVLLAGLFMMGNDMAVAADDDLEEVLDEGGEYDDDIELDEDDETYDPDDVAEVDGDITISGDNVTVRNFEVDGDVIIDGDNVELEDVEVSGNVEIHGDEASLDDVEVGRDVMVEGEDARLDNVTISGDLEIEEDVEEDFSGQNVTVKGAVLVNGGGPDSVHFEDSDLKDMEVNCEDVHIQLSGETRVTGSVNVAEPSTFTLEDSSSIEGTVTVDANSTFYLDDSSSIDGTVSVNRASTFELEKDATITRIDVNADEVEILGTGTIYELYAEDENDVDIDDDLTIVTFNDRGDNGTAIIGAGKSGTVRLGDDAMVQVPAGATDVNVRVTIKEVTNHDELVGQDQKLLSPVYELTRTPGGSFKKPVIITFAFDSGKLSSGEVPSVFYYDDAKKVWMERGGTVSGRTIAVDVDHFATLAVFAKKNEQQLPEPSPSPEPITVPTFTDIAGHWAEQQIRKAAQLGIVKGYQDGTFRPNAKVNRFEFAVMLARLKNLSEASDASLPFKDADKIPAWARGMIASAVEARLVLGDAAGYFRPTSILTRVQMAVMIARTAGLDNRVNYAGQLSFADAANIPDWAKSSVASVTKAGLMSGSNGKFMPNEYATRAQIVAVLVKLAER